MKIVTGKDSVFSVLIIYVLSLACGRQKSDLPVPRRTLEKSVAAVDHIQGEIKNPLLMQVPNGATPECRSGGSLESQRLTKYEYDNVIRDLFNLKSNLKFAEYFSEPSSGPAGFSTEGKAQNFSGEIVLDFYKAAIAVSDAVVANEFLLQANCTGEEVCVRQKINALVTKGFRRPAEPQEVDVFYGLYLKASEKSFQAGMKLVIRAMLMSPHFIFRIYSDSNDSSEKVPLNDYQLASRLSFFIHGSLPDDALLQLAKLGTLHQKEILAAQARRLLQDPKAVYFSRTYGAQWLGLARLNKIELDPSRFPNWNAEVKNSMREETLAFFDNLVLKNKSPFDMITADYSFGDQNVAKIYGITGATSQKSSELLKLDSTRRGLLSQPALLAMNSAGDHTVPVVRGKWVLEKMLCSAPPPPPADVALMIFAQGATSKSESKVRERLAAHRTQGSSCKNCHAFMDPVGLAFENFDSMGSFRDRYTDGAVVDASGVLPSGETLKNYSDLSSVLENDTRFPLCFSAHLLSFATGQDMHGPQSKCEVKTIADAAVRKDKTFADVVVEVVLSDSFLFRK